MMLFGIPLLLILLFGLIVGFLRLQEWTGKQIDKRADKRRKVPAAVVVYRMGGREDFAFPTMQEAARDALKRLENPELGYPSCIMQEGGIVWEAIEQTDVKASLEELAN